MFVRHIGYQDYGSTLLPFFSKQTLAHDNLVSCQKRRVTPTPLANPVVDSAFIMAKVEAPVNALQNHNNNAKFPGTGPLKVDMDILMQRCEKNRKQKQKEKPEILKKSDVSNPGTFEGLESGSASSTQGITVCSSPTESLPEVKVAGVSNSIGSQHAGSPCQTTAVSGEFPSLKSRYLDI